MSSQIDNKLLQAIRLVAFDVDGVFTDGRFYLADDGTESKAFHTQDGYGVRRLVDRGFQVAVISGRESAAVSLRMQELQVQHVILGCKDKVAAFEKLLQDLGLTRQQAAYVGDDIPDLQLLQYAGLSFAVANAVAEVREVCHYTTRAPGGAGAVREISDILCRNSC